MILRCYKVEQEGDWSRPDGMREASRALRIRQLMLKIQSTLLPLWGAADLTATRIPPGPNLKTRPRDNQKWIRSIRFTRKAIEPKELG